MNPNIFIIIIFISFLVAIGLIIFISKYYQTSLSNLCAQCCNYLTYKHTKESNTTIVSFNVQNAIIDQYDDL